MVESRATLAIVEGTAPGVLDTADVALGAYDPHLATLFANIAKGSAASGVVVGVNFGKTGLVFREGLGAGPVASAGGRRTILKEHWSGALVVQEGIPFGANSKVEKVNERIGVGRPRILGAEVSCEKHACFVIAHSDAEVEQLIPKTFVAFDGTIVSCVGGVSQLPHSIGLDGAADRHFGRDGVELEVVDRLLDFGQAGRSLSCRDVKARFESMMLGHYGVVEAGAVEEG